MLERLRFLGKNHVGKGGAALIQARLLDNK